MQCRPFNMPDEAFSGLHCSDPICLCPARGLASHTVNGACSSLSPQGRGFQTNVIFWIARLVSPEISPYIGSSEYNSTVSRTVSPLTAPRQLEGCTSE